MTAAVISPAQGHRSASRSRRRRPPRTSRPAAESRRRRSRLGSQRRAVPVRASSWVQASSSQARETISHQSWFWAKPWRGRFRSPVSFAQRIRSSQRGPLPVAEFQVSELPFLRVGGEGGEPVPVEVGEPQLRARVRAFFPDDDPHPGRPGRQVQQPGDVRDPGAVPHLAVPVVSRRPGAGGDLHDRFSHVVGDRHADGVVQAAGPGGQPFQEPAGAAAGAGADQHPAAQVPGQLRQRQAGRLDMAGRRVRPGVSRSQHDREGLPVPAGPVVGEGGHGMEAERLRPS
jgi:hypothetical protein